MECHDNGMTLALTVARYDVVGEVEIGPISVADVQRLSFPEPDVNEWMRDVAVQFREML